MAGRRRGGAVRAYRVFALMISHLLVVANSYTAYAALRAGYRVAGLRNAVAPRPVPPMDVARTPFGAPSFK